MYWHMHKLWNINIGKAKLNIHFEFVRKKLGDVFVALMFQWNGNKGAAYWKEIDKFMCVYGKHSTYETMYTESIVCTLKM